MAFSIVQRNHGHLIVSFRTREGAEDVCKTLNEKYFVKRKKTKGKMDKYKQQLMDETAPYWVVEVRQ